MKNSLHSQWGMEYEGTQGFIMQVYENIKNQACDWFSKALQRY